MHILDVLASQDQSGGDATVTIDQRKYSSKISDKSKSFPQKYNQRALVSFKVL